ncbi:hypothetical protein J3R82DRAFT_2864 [Butyriboletus roseoflavus]|nr:hypothetical protein J3R82DRAFT_2864 [Butyriboletus roseoflavus]
MSGSSRLRLRNTSIATPPVASNSQSCKCHSRMAQATVTLVHHKHTSPSKAKRDILVRLTSVDIVCLFAFQSERGGSGNNRHSKTSTHSERSPNPLVLPPRERQGTSTADKFMSSGRGGSGNIQPSMSSLEAHPLTASILKQHSAMQAQYEQRVRKAHAESNVVRSTGRGGSGNISDPRRRSRSQEPKSMSKRHFFTKKGRERGTRCDGVMQAHDGENGTSIISDTEKRCGVIRTSSCDQLVLVLAQWMTFRS